MTATEEMLQEPWRFDFFSVMRRLERINPDLFMVAGIIALIKLMTAREFGAHGIPNQLEQFDPLLRRRIRSAIVAVDEWTKFRIQEIFPA